VFLTFAACATSRAPLHPTSPQGRWHLVASGETAESLAREAGVPLEDLLEVNGLERASAVHPGLLLFLLEPGAQPGPPGPSRAGAPAAVASAEAGPQGPASASGAATSLSWPVATPRITSPFGARWGRPHEGVDLVAAPGTPVLAAADGVVAYAGHGIRGYGNLIVLSHPGGLLTVYAHNSVLSARQGERVKRGHVIALSGQSGRATAPHLHFEVRRGESPVDPLPFLPPLSAVSEQRTP
jgi:murein DD-endopeptidase MepM/ murein hydrolase activator NlpD